VANRIDELVAAAARALAGRRTRRDVLERFGATGAGMALLGFEPLVDVFTAEPRRPRRSWRSGAVGQDEVAVCYTPLRVAATEPALARRGATGVIVRKAPSFDAPPAPMNDGGLAIAPLNTHFARQSARRAPGPGCRAPSPRAAVNGFVWGYPADDVPTNKSGWVPLEVDGVRYLEDDPGYGTRPGDPERYVCGPRSKDFDCRSEASKAYCGYICGGNPLAGFHYVGKLRRVLATGLGEPRDSGEEYYLRWAASSTAFSYLAPGDVVFELGRQPGLSYGPHTVPWSFVEVRRGALTPAGTRGWCLHDAFLPADQRLLAPYLRGRSHG
jgi:hypothetical protein